jgi:hypothetical protein
MVRDAVNGGIPTGQLVPQLSQLVGVLPPEYARAPKQTFIPTFDVKPLNALASVSKTYRVDPSVDFIGIVFNGSIRSADEQTDGTNAPVTFTLTDETGRSYVPNNGALDFRNIFGSGLQPGILPVPIIIEGNTGLVLTYTNNHATLAYSVRVALMGFTVNRQQLANIRRALNIAQS